MNARGLALVRAVEGDLAAALGWVEESLRPLPWYLWTQGYALEAALTVAETAGDPRAARWNTDLVRIAGRAQLGIGRTLPQAALNRPI